MPDYIQLLWVTIQFKRGNLTIIKEEMGGDTQILRTKVIRTIQKNKMTCTGRIFGV